jgi:hypothetical protein
LGAIVARGGVEERPWKFRNVSRSLVKRTMSRMFKDTILTVNQKTQTEIRALSMAFAPYVTLYQHPKLPKPGADERLICRRPAVASNTIGLIFNFPEFPSFSVSIFSMDSD